MSYFKKFPKITYNGQLGVDILTAVIPSRMNIDKAFVYQNHVVGDDETPESLADKLYNDANLYWVILVVNRIVDSFTGWPISDAVFEEFVEKKYGSLHGIHHFWDNRINRMCDDVDDFNYRQVDVSTLPFYIVPVTNAAREREINDSKRSILVINPRYINQFVETYTRAIEGKE